MIINLVSTPSWSNKRNKKGGSSLSTIQSAVIVSQSHSVQVVLLDPLCINLLHATRVLRIHKRIDLEAKCLRQLLDIIAILKHDLLQLFEQQRQQIERLCDALRAAHIIVHAISTVILDHVRRLIDARVEQD